MRANVPAITKLIEDNFDGSKKKFAEAIGVERSFVSTVIHGNGKGAGAKFFGGVMRYCEKEGMDFKKYIFLR